MVLTRKLKNTGEAENAFNLHLRTSIKLIKFRNTSQLFLRS